MLENNGFESIFINNILQSYQLLTKHHFAEELCQYFKGAIAFPVLCPKHNVSIDFRYFSYIEHDAKRENFWIWCDNPQSFGQIVFFNHSNHTENIMLCCDITGLGGNVSPELLDFRLNDTKSTYFNFMKESLQIPIKLVPGKNLLNIQYNQAPQFTGNDPRPLSFRLVNPCIQYSAQQNLQHSILQHFEDFRPKQYAPFTTDEILRYLHAVGFAEVHLYSEGKNNNTPILKQKTRTTIYPKWGDIDLIEISDSKDDGSFSPHKKWFIAYRHHRFTLNV